MTSAANMIVSSLRHLCRRVNPAAAILLVWMGACQGGDSQTGPGPELAASVALDQSSLSVELGASAQLVAEARNAAGQLISRPVQWSSENPTIATVSGTGVIATHAVGYATITATADGKRASAGVTVTPATVATVVIAATAPSMFIGNSLQLGVTARDARGAVLSDRAVTWQTGNAAVATVSASGRVSAVSLGSALITAAVEGRTGEVTVTVIPVPVASVSVTPANADFFVGDTLRLSATLRDSAGGVLAGRSVSWASSNAAVITVSSTGLASGVAAGSATITATVEGKSASAVISATVAPITTVEVTPALSSLSVGQVRILVAVAKDARGVAQPGRAVTWASSNNVVATVSQTGAVTAVSPGNAEISAVVEGRTGLASIIVHTGVVAQIRLSTGIVALLVGEERALDATAVDAAGQEVPGVVVRWESSNATVAEVVSGTNLIGTTPPRGGAVEELVDAPRARAIGFGTTTLTASAEGQTASLQLFSARAPTGTFTALLQRCPSPAEIAFVVAAVRSLDFSGDPTAGNLECSAQGGSADLTRLQRRTYMSLLGMASLRFSEALPWTPLNLFEWFASQIRGIRFRLNIGVSFCCDPAGVINIQTGNLALASFPTFEATLASIALALFIHEVRHMAFGGHTCGTKDNTIAELGSWGVQYHFYRLLGTASDPVYVPPTEQTTIAGYATSLRNSVFCMP